MNSGYGNGFPAETAAGYTGATLGGFPISQKWSFVILGLVLAFVWWASTSKPSASSRAEKDAWNQKVAQQNAELRQAIERNRPVTVVSTGSAAVPVAPVTPAAPSNTLVFEPPTALPTMEVAQARVAAMEAAASAPKQPTTSWHDQADAEQTAQNDADMEQWLGQPVPARWNSDAALSYQTFCESDIQFSQAYRDRGNTKCNQMKPMKAAFDASGLTDQDLIMMEMADEFLMLPSDTWDSNASSMYGVFCAQPIDAANAPAWAQKYIDPVTRKCAELLKIMPPQ